MKLGSLFSGIGGFELGLERAIPELETIWQVEQDKFCQKVLKKHWPNSQIYNDITTINTKDLKDIDILCGGFPCQDISIAGKRTGLNGKKSGLFWEMYRIISDFKQQKRPIKIILMENVPAITFRGLGTVLGAFSQIGYNVEWFDLRAVDFGAPHKRERWFAIAYPPSKSIKKHPIHPICLESKKRFEYRTIQKDGIFKENYWEKCTVEPPLCSLDDGIPQRVASLRALGNSIVPQCSEWIGKRLIETGLLKDMLCY